MQSGRILFKAPDEDLWACRMLQAHGNACGVLWLHLEEAAAWFTVVGCHHSPLLSALMLNSNPTGIGTREMEKLPGLYTLGTPSFREWSHGMMLSASWGKAECKNFHPFLPCAFAGEVEHCIDLSAGQFSFAINSYVKKRERRKCLVETVKDEKNLLVEFSAPGSMHHDDVWNVTSLNVR